MAGAVVGAVAATAIAAGTQAAADTVCVAATRDAELMAAPIAGQPVPLAGRSARLVGTQPPEVALLPPRVADSAAADTLAAASMEAAAFTAAAAVATAVADTGKFGGTFENGPSASAGGPFSME